MSSLNTLFSLNDLLVDETDAVLNKALSAGYETDALRMQGGRALIPEDIEATMYSVMEAEQEDCKFINMLDKITVGSTVHTYNRRLGVGGYENLVVEEGGASETNDQDIKRVVVSIKYIQDRRAITDQMAKVRSFEDVYNSEKTAGTLNVLKAAEMLCFHGNEDVNPLEFDGVIRQIEKSPNPNIVDVRGKTIATLGDSVITDPVRQINERGGRGDKLFMPYVLVQDIQDLAKDRMRFTPGGSSMAFVMDQYPTAYGSSVYFGKEAGGDRLFKPKGEIKEGMNPKRPKRPQVANYSTTSASNSKFGSSDAGVYKYRVHAINRYGISQSYGDNTVSVSSGQKVMISITAESGSDETGYIICRTAKNGSTFMEMTRIPRNMSGATVFEDINEDLPGTASMVLVTDHKIQPMLAWLQLCPISIRPLSPFDRAETPFLVQFFGALDVKAPHWCALVKNIQYRGGLKY